MSSFNNIRIQNKRDTAANWETNNPILLNGELIIVYTNAGDIRFKIGDGTKTYTQLPFQDETLYNVLSGKSDKHHTHVASEITDLGTTIADAVGHPVRFTSWTVDDMGG